MIYPKNKEHFKKLIPFAKKIILICKKNKIPVAIYGSFAHFYHTKDENMKVNDIDLLIPEKYHVRMCNLLEKEKINFEPLPKYFMIIARKERVKVEVDTIGEGYPTLNETAFSNRAFPAIDFYGLRVRMITLKHLEEIYPVAYNRSREDKAKILKKIRHLEKYLGRKLR